MFQQRYPIAIYVFLGGFLGGVLRLLMMGFEKDVHAQLLSLTIANLAGTVVLAIASEFNMPSHIASFVKTGFLGSFTSFGTLMILFIQSSWALRTTYLIISLFGSYFLVYLSRKLVDGFKRLNHHG